MDIRQFLNQQGWSWTEKQRPSGLIAEMTCPFCKSKEKSFAVSLNDGAFSCFRLNNCGVKGSFWDLQKMLGLTPQRLDNVWKFVSSIAVHSRNRRIAVYTGCL